MVLACGPFVQQRDALKTIAIRDGYFTRANEWFQGTLRKQRSSAFYHREVGNTQQLPTCSHMFQPFGLAALRKLPAAP